ncbi:MAG: hypothetical protein II836_09735 [Clostridia bacterium]|nr:hypothetical protein [Clostridia bacterium]MBR4186717.1 hypothetical protein [Clostridia bacterium]
MENNNESVLKNSETASYNRYALVVASAKCARIITDEYTKQREVAEKIAASSKDSEKKSSIASMIKKEYRDEKAVKTAITGLYNGDFKIIEPDGEEKFITRQQPDNLAEAGEFPDEEEREESIDNYALDANTPPKKAVPEPAADAE